MMFCYTKKEACLMDWDLYIKGKKQTFPHIILSFVFCFYLFGILTMTGVWWLRPFSPVFEWVPFVDMVRGPIQTV